MNFYRALEYSISMKFVKACVYQSRAELHASL